MITLPTGQNLYNGTPHSIRLWSEGMESALVVPSDFILNTHQQILGDPIIKTGGILIYKAISTAYESERNLLMNLLLEDPTAIVIGSVQSALAHKGFVYMGIKSSPPTRNMNLKTFHIDKFATF